MAIDFDFSGIPAERLTLIGDSSLASALAHIVNRYVPDSDFLLEHQSNYYPACHGGTHSSGSAERCLCRGLYPGDLYPELWWLSRVS